MMSLILKITIRLFIISLVSFSIMAARVKEMKPYKRRSTFYALIAAIAYGLAALFFFIFTYVPWVMMFIILVIFYAGLNVAHHYVGRIILPWTRKAHVFWIFIYSMIIALLGTIVFMFGYYFFSKGGFNFAFIIVGVMFFVPVFILHSYRAFHAIPQKVFKKWYYPIGQAIDDPSDRELESPFVISFEFEKKFDDNEVTSFRAKAPKYMKYGRLFYFFINDYNSRHPESKIDYIYDKSKSYGWVFYVKPNWYESLSYINPDETIAENRIEENTVVICKRIMD
jgi:hypothetical protein